MKILQLIQTEQYRGAEIFCCQLSNHLLALGHQVVVVSIFEGTADLPFKGKIRSLARIKRNRYTDYKGWKKLADIINSVQPDIVQANAADTLKYTVLSKLLYKWDVPLVYRNASTASFYIKNPLIKFFNSFLFRNVDLIISVSKASKKDINQLFPSTTSKSCVIPVGVEESNMTRSVVKKSDKKKVLHIGSFTREKNHFELIEIFKLISEKDVDVVLELIGEGPLQKEVEKYVLQSGLGDQVKFLGAIKAPWDHIRSANVLILPSRIEGLPGVLLEAMYCRVPVVAYDVGGISEILDDSTGSLIKKGKKQEFAQAVLEDLHRPDQQKIAEAHRRILEDFSNSSISLKFVNSYKKLAATTD